MEESLSLCMSYLISVLYPWYNLLENPKCWFLKMAFIQCPMKSFWQHKYLFSLTFLWIWWLFSCCFESINDNQIFLFLTFIPMNCQRLYNFQVFLIWEKGILNWEYFLGYYLLYFNTAEILYIYSEKVEIQGRKI